MDELERITKREHNILILDKDPTKIEEIRSALTGIESYFLDSTTDKTAFTEKIKQASFDVIIFHYDQSIKGTRNIFKKLSSDAPDTPVIVTTEKYDEELEYELLNSSVYAFIDRGEIKAPRFQGHIRNAINFTQSCTDAKTGFYSSDVALKRLDEEIKRVAGRKTNTPSFRSRRSDSIYSLILMDIDDFKGINDVYGHIEGGDVVLQKVANEISINTRPNDIHGRYGGDELVVGFSGNDYEWALDRAELIRRNIENLEVHSKDKRIIPVTVTIGVVTIPQIGIENTVKGVLDAADRALYLGKKLSKNTVVGYLDL